MKKIIVGFFLLLLASRVLAATDEANLDKQVKELKKKIEHQTKKEKEQVEKVIAGFVTKIENQTIWFAEEKNFKVDEQLTRYFRISKNRFLEIKNSEIQEGDYIFAIGPELEGSINALEVYKDKKYKILSGIVVEVDRKNYFLRVLTEFKSEKIVDIEKKTKQLILVKDKENFEFEKVGFSKIKENDYVIFIYNQESYEDKERVSAEKILIIPQELIESLRANSLK